MTAASSSTGPMNVLNIRLKRRGAESGPPSTGQRRPSRSTIVGSRRSVARQVLGARQLVEPEAAVVGRALDERIAERADVAGRDPDLGMHQDPGVETDDVVALLDHRPPPGALDVVLQLDAERPVVPDGVDAAVDLGRGEDEAAPLGERDDRVEVGDGGRDVVGGRSGLGHGTDSCGGRPWQGRPRGRDRPGDASQTAAQTARQGALARRRTALPPMTAGDRRLVETGGEQGIGEAGRGRRHRSGPARRRRSRTRARRGRPPPPRPPGPIARAIGGGRRRRRGVGQNPIPISPPVAAIPRTCSSGRLRALSQTPRTPACDTTTGRVAMARTSSIVAVDAWARSTSIERASSGSTTSRPMVVRPSFSTPWADPANGVVEEVVATTSGSRHRPGRRRSPGRPRARGRPRSPGGRP